MTRVMSWEIPMALPSRANLEKNRWHRQKLVKQQRECVDPVLAMRKPPELPVTVRLWRVAPRALDGDNLAGALKAVQDCVARWLGCDDADPRVVWLPPKQDKDGRARYTAARIEVWPGVATCRECKQAVVPG